VSVTLRHWRPAANKTRNDFDNHQDMPSKARSTRPKSNVNKRPLRQNSSTPNKRRTNRQKRAPPTPPSEDGQAASGPEDAEDGASDTYQEEDDDVKSLHSDTLDDDSDRGVRKRKHASPVKPRSPRKKRKNAKNDEDEEGEDYGLKEGQQVVGRVVQPPKEGRGKDLYTARGSPTLIYRRSAPRSDIPKHVRLPFTAHKTRMQRP
jgi:hypothetical protein